MAEKPPIPTPHDRLFKETFSHLEAARDFLQTHLPPRLVAALDWPTLSLVPGSFVDEHLASQSSDLLYQVSWREWPLYLYCLTMPEELCAELAPYQPDFVHVLVNLADLSIEQMGRDLVGRLTLSLMKAAAEGRLLQWMVRAVPFLAELLAQGGDRAGQFRTLLRYLFGAEANASSTFVDLVSRIENEMVKENVMSIADQLIQQGLEKGMEKGSERGLADGLQKGRQEGMARGSLMGRIQAYQELLNLPVNQVAELEQRDPAELETLWRELQTQLRQRLA